MTEKKQNPCESAIKKTIAYRIMFKYPLTEYQLKTMLISNRKFEENYFSDQLRSLTKKGDVKSRDHKYYGPGFKPVNWYKKAESSKKHIEEAKHIAKTLSVIPWIKLIGVTGSVAAYNSEDNSDIDFFIVATKNRLWLTRLFTVMLLKSIGLYRTNKFPNGKICPNIYVDEQNLSWPKNKRNLFIAQEIIMMHPVLNRENIYFKFIKANQWLFEYFRGFNISYPTKAEKETKQSKIIHCIENLSRKVQIWYMKKRKTSEITERGLIHFNRDDWTNKILTKYEDAVKNL
jgi:hypothetical protein